MDFLFSSDYERFFKVILLKLQCLHSTKASFKSLKTYQKSSSIYCRMSQDRPSSRDGTSKLLNHVLMQTSPMQYNNNNNNLILNKNNFLSIDTPSNNMNGTSNSNILIHNKNSCNMVLTTTTSTVAAPPPSVNYISKETINCF